MKTKQVLVFLLSLLIKGVSFSQNHIFENNDSIFIGSRFWNGTGFALCERYITTNYHVVKDADIIYVCGVNGAQDSSYKAIVYAVDSVNDLAILKICDSSFDGFGMIPYGINNQMAEVGDEIFVLGFPLTQTMGEEIKLTNGIISSSTGYQGNVAMYQMSAPIQPGNSGGPMFDKNGNIVGVICAYHLGAENVGYAIKTMYLKELCDLNSIKIPYYNKKTLSTLPLSGKVKKIKKFVYLIRCINNKDDILPSFEADNYNRDRIISYPPVSFIKSSNNLTVKSVTISESYTAIEIHSKYSGIEWCCINAETYIIVEGKKLKLKKVEGISIYPKLTYYIYNDLTFTLFFPPISNTVNEIDLIEQDIEVSGVGNWEIHGIKLNNK